MLKFEIRKPKNPALIILVIMSLWCELDPCISEWKPSFSPVLSPFPCLYIIKAVSANLNPETLGVQGAILNRICGSHTRLHTSWHFGFKRQSCEAGLNSVCPSCFMNTLQDSRRQVVEFLPVRCLCSCTETYPPADELSWGGTLASFTMP